MGRNVGRSVYGLGCVPDFIYSRVSGWEDGVMRYRICRNEAPHKDPWWSVEFEQEMKSSNIWGATKVDNVWKPVIEWPEELCGFARPVKFTSQSDAQAYVDECKRPVVHECGEPQ